MSEKEKVTQDVSTEAKAKPAKENKPAKAKKDKKPNRILRWLKDMKGEMKKVTWPSGKDTWRNVLIVIVCVILVGVCIWVFDLVAKQVVGALLKLFN